METLKIEAGEKNPAVTFDPSGALLLKGRSIPENSLDFYQDLFSWLDQYSSAPAGNTTLTVQLEYFNTSSSKCLLDLFRKLESIKSAGNSQVNIIWLYDEDDEDIMEAGEDYQSIVEVPIELRAV
ncbi:MAG: DUF1987 domain-containing protein [Bacteroidia bacterium]|nr:DUF1987 domain-containing protein [Bacteroidia bacterium]